MLKDRCPLVRRPSLRCTETREKRRKPSLIGLWIIGEI
jgi:hypothetical protein